MVYGYAQFSPLAYRALYLFALLFGGLSALAQDSSTHQGYWELAERHASETHEDSALHYYQKALNGFEGEADWSSYADCSLAALPFLKRARLYEQALAMLTPTPAAFYQYLETHMLDKGLYYGHLGNLHHRLRQYPQALSAYQLSLAAKLQTTTPDSIWIAGSYVNLALLYKQEGRYEQAIRMYEHIAPLLDPQQEENHALLSTAYNNLGSLYKRKGDYQEAINFYHRSRLLRQESLGALHPRMAIPYNNLAQIYLKQKVYDQALYYAKQALSIREHQANPHPGKLASALISVGGIYQEQGAFSTSANYFQEAINRLQQVEDPPLPFLAAAYHNLSISLMNQQVLPAAERAAQEALKWREQLYQSHPDLAASYDQLAYLARLRGAYGNATKLHLQAIEVLSPTLADSTLLQVEAKPELMELLLSLGETLSQQADRQSAGFSTLVQAFQAYRKASLVADAIRQSYQSRDAAQLLKGNIHQVYQGLIQSAYQLYEQSQEVAYLRELYHFMEKSKSMLLYEAVRETQALQKGGIAEAFLEEEAALKQELHIYRQTLSKISSPDQDSAVELQRKVLQTQASYDSLMHELETRYPAFFKLRSQHEPASLTRVQQLLKEDQQILSYYWGQSALYVLSIRASAINASRIPLGASFRNTLLQFRAQLTSPASLYRSSSESLAAFSHSAYQLHEQLLGTLIQAATKQLILLPDGPLQYIPFEVLLSPQGEKKASNFRQLPYLIRDYTVQYAYSATLFLANKQEVSPQAPLPTLALAPAFSDQRTGPAERGQGFPVLKWAQKEVNLIHQIAGGTKLVAEQASKQAFLEKAPEYGILHLATHAYVDPQQSSQSFLLFASEDQAEGRVFAWELYMQRFQAQMAVLSACSTGEGTWQKGEGVMSLARAFAYAGVPSVLMSLWPAQDRSTSQIMQTYYKALAKQQAKHIAIQQAKLAYLKRADALHAHPYFWAGFILQGEEEALQLQTPSSPYMMWYVCGLGLLLLTLALFYFTRKRS